MATAMPVREQVITDAGTPATISVANNAWTAVPATASVMAGRCSMYVTVDDGAGASGYAIITMNTTAPSTATTVRPITFQAGITQLIPLQSGSYLWMLSGGAGSINIHYQEVVQ